MASIFSAVYPGNCAICHFLPPSILPFTYNPIAHSLIHGRPCAPTAMISVARGRLGAGTVCNLYCMFLWQKGERKEREVSPRSCSAPYSPEGNVE